MQRLKLKANSITKKALSLFLVLAFTLSLSQTLFILPAKAAVTNWMDPGNYSTGWYTSNPSSTVFSISSASQLAGLAVLVNAGTDDFTGQTIELSNDIDLTENNWTPIGTFSNVFKGNFNGEGFEIKNMQINMTNSGSSIIAAGLFGVAYITNLLISNVGIDSSSSITVSITGSGGCSAGGIVGKAEFGKIQNCNSNANITVTSSTNASLYIGGIAGILSECAIIENCYNTGNVSANAGNETNANIYVAGIAGGSINGGSIKIATAVLIVLVSLLAELLIQQQQV
jgi:hypothetical protein